MDPQSPATAEIMEIATAKTPEIAIVTRIMEIALELYLETIQRRFAVRIMDDVIVGMLLRASVMYQSAVPSQPPI